MLVRIDPVDGLLFVDAASTASLTLSGLQTVDGVALTAGKLCLAKNQVSAQAIYLVQAGAWVPVDPGIGFGLHVCVRSGGQAGTIFRCTTLDPVMWGNTPTTFVTSSASAGAFNAAAPPALGVTTPNVASFQNLSLTGSQPTPVTGQPSLFRSIYGDGSVRLGIQNDAGSQIELGSSALTATAQGGVDLLPFTLAANGTRDYVPGNGGLLLVCVPATASAPMALLGVSGNGSVTLNGATLAGGISTTLDNANTLNIYQISGNKFRFQNKTAGTVQVLAVFIGFGAA